MSLRVAAALRPAKRRLRVIAALRPAERLFRVCAALRAIARRLRVAAAFRAASLARCERFVSNGAMCRGWMVCLEVALPPAPKRRALSAFSSNLVRPPRVMMATNRRIKLSR
jgi:hypothetical protein